MSLLSVPNPILPDAPALLLVSFAARGSGAAALPRLLSAAGVRVSALAPVDDPLAAAGGVGRHFPLADSRDLRAVESRLAAAMAAVRPALVVPCDVPAAACLQGLVRDPARRRLDAGMIRVLIESLGDPSFFDALLMRDAMAARAREIGVRVPDGTAVTDASAAQAAAARLGGPVIVRSGMPGAGPAARICRCAAEIDAAMAQRPRRRPWPGGFTAPVWPRAGDPAEGSALVQRVIAGRRVLVAAVAWRGAMLAAVSGEVPVGRAARGPHPVAGLGPRPELEMLAEQVIAGTGAAGYLGFEFVIERTSGLPFLLECRPVPAPDDPRNRESGAGLAAALAACLRAAEPVAEDRRARAVRAAAPHPEPLPARDPAGGARLPALVQRILRALRPPALPGPGERPAF